MRAILKALGLTIWSAIGILLTVIVVVAAFEVAAKYRASGVFDLEKETNTQPVEARTQDSAASVALPARAPEAPVQEVVPQAAQTDCANAPPVALDAPQLARLGRLLDSSDAAKADSGDAFVRLGEKYYGFGEYELAIASIQRGLEKGHVTHLDEAYVYLGRSEVATGDLDTARDAFGKLKDVPDISPNVVNLWTLYADMLSAKTEPVTAAECRKDGA